MHSSDFCVFLWVLGGLNPSFKYEYCTNAITSGHMTQEKLLRAEEKTKAPQLARTFQNVTTHQNLWRMFQYLKCEVYAWRSSWQPDSDHAACVSRLCDIWNQCSAWYGTSLIQRCQICGTSDLRRGKNAITSLISMISKSSCQMILSYHRNHMKQQTFNQSTVKCNRQYKTVQWVVFLRQYVIGQKLLFCLFSEKAEQVKQKSPGSAPASAYLSQAKSACNYTHTARRKQEFIEFTVTLQMCPAGGRNYS